MMRASRFGQKLRLPSTFSIKHELLTMLLEEEIRAVPADQSFNKETSPALARLRRLMTSQVAH